MDRATYRRNEFRVMSPAQRAALEKARLASPLIPIPTVQDANLPA
jgi:hypothetical protein